MVIAQTPIGIMALSNREEARLQPRIVHNPLLEADRTLRVQAVPQDVVVARRVHPVNLLHRIRPHGPHLLLHIEVQEAVLHQDLLLLPEVLEEDVADGNLQ